MNASRRTLRRPLARRQRGAVLYIALILLILLSLLGIAGVQVASMQEKMSSAWRANNISFQNTESQIRQRELAMEAAPDAVVVDEAFCAPFDPAAWAEEKLGDGDMNGVYVKKVDCPEGNWEPQGEIVDQQYAVTSFATDEAAITDEATSESVVDTIFIP